MKLCGKTTLIITLVIVILLGCCACSAEMKTYKQASKLLAEAQYDMAIALFEGLGDYKDSAENVLKAKYQKACTAEQNGDYESAMAQFSEISGYSEAAVKILECRYELAKQYYLDCDYKRAYDAFVALGGYGDSKEQAVLTRSALENQMAQQYLDGAVKDLSKVRLYGVWNLSNTDIYYTFLPTGVCRIMDTLELEKPLEDYNEYKWKFEEGALIISKDDAVVETFVVLSVRKSKVELYDRLNLCERSFVRNTSTSFNVELDCGILIGMTKTTVKRLEMGTVKVAANTYIQYHIFIHGIKQSYSGTRTYYFNSKGKLYKTVITLDSLQGKDVLDNYADLSQTLNKCFYKASCADIKNKERVAFGNGSYMERMKPTKSVLVTLWATTSGGMIWVQKNK